MVWAKGSSGKIMEGDCELETVGENSWLPVTDDDDDDADREGLEGRWRQLRHSPGDPVTTDIQLRDKHKPQCHDEYEMNQRWLR